MYFDVDSAVVETVFVARTDEHLNLCSYSLAAQFNILMFWMFVLDNNKANVGVVITVVVLRLVIQRLCLAVLSLFLAVKKISCNALHNL